jgi:hypothetical protein
MAGTGPPQAKGTPLIAAGLVDALQGAGPFTCLRL